MTEKAMPLLEHLREFRKRIVLCFVVAFVGMIAAYTAYNPWIRNLLLGPIDALAGNEKNPFVIGNRLLELVKSATPELKTLNLKMHAMGVTEGFIVRMRASLYAGMVLASPFLLYQAWAFIGAGLKQNERSSIRIFMPVALMLFVCGALMAYFVLLPIALCFMLVIGNRGLELTIRFQEYVPIVVWACLGLGLVFETPLMILFLTKVGIVSPKTLASKRKHAIVIMFVLAAVLTPPDFITQIMLALPMIVLYEISIILSRFAYAKRQKALQG